MTEFGFDLLIVATGLVSLTGIIVMELTRERLPAPLAQVALARKQALVEWSNRVWWPTPLSRAILLGYFLALVLLGFDVPYSNWLLLVCSIGWTYLSMQDAPAILHRYAVPFYELSLLLNGAVLALSFVGVPA